MLPVYSNRVEIHHSWLRGTEIVGRISFTSSNKIWLLLLGNTLNTQFLNRNMDRYPLRILCKSGKKYGAMARESFTFLSKVWVMQHCIL
jgi:hypothetical protein